MLTPNKIRIAREVAPLLEELLRLVDLLQTDPQTEDDLLAQIAAYGVIIQRGAFTLSALRNILNSLQTVGIQISQCFNRDIVETTSTPFAADSQIVSTQNEVVLQESFKQVFNTIEFVYANDPNEPPGVTSYNESTKTITVQLSPDAFSICRKYYLNVNGKPEGKAVDDQELPCPPDGEEMVDGQMKRFVWIKEPFADRTTEGIIRHEIGHGLLRLLIDSYGETSFKETYFESVSNNFRADLEQTTRNDDDKVFLLTNRYFRNAGELDRNYNADQEWTEDFADTFSLMGRFINGTNAFFQPDDQNILQQTTRYQVFNSEFCCWIGEITNQPNLCQ